MIVELKEGERRTDTKIVHLTYQLNYNIHLILMGPIYRNHFEMLNVFSYVSKTNGN